MTIDVASEITKMLHPPPLVRPTALRAKAIIVAMHEIPRLLARSRSDVPIRIWWLEDGDPRLPVADDAEHLCAVARYADGQELYAPYALRG